MPSFSLQRRFMKTGCPIFFLRKVHIEGGCAAAKARIAPPYKRLSRKRQIAVGRFQSKIKKYQPVKSGVERYRPPVSGSSATIVFPLFSGRFAS